MGALNYLYQKTISQHNFPQYKRKLHSKASGHEAKCSGFSKLFMNLLTTLIKTKNLITKNHIFFALHAKYEILFSITIIKIHYLFRFRLTDWQVDLTNALKVVLSFWLSVAPSVKKKEKQSVDLMNFKTIWLCEFHLKLNETSLFLRAINHFTNFCCQVTTNLPITTNSL